MNTLGVMSIRKGGAFVQHVNLRDEVLSGPLDGRALPASVRVLGALCFMGGLVLMMLAFEALYRTGVHFVEGDYASEGLSATIVIVMRAVVLAALAVAVGLLGFSVLRNRRRLAAQLARVVLVLVFAAALCDIMILGVTWRLAPLLAAQVAAVAAQAYLDPSIREERRLRRKLHNMELRDEAAEGTLGRDRTGRGYLELNFFNLFWIFTVASVLGLLFETTFHELYYHAYQNRAGLLFGPFSPIYGIGAVLMTLALNRLHDANVVVLFLASALIGGAFEYAASWFMQLAFGVVSWDYSNMWLSIGGRTCVPFMALWGLMGVLWVKFALPALLRLVNLVPWRWRYALTAVCATLMLVDVVMTLQALDCWYERASGAPATSNIQRFYAAHFDDSYMQNRFQSMVMHPETATRG